MKGSSFRVYRLLVVAAIAATACGGGGGEKPGADVSDAGVDVTVDVAVQDAFVADPGADSGQPDPGADTAGDPGQDTADPGEDPGTVEVFVDPGQSVDLGTDQGQEPDPFSPDLYQPSCKNGICDQTENCMNCPDDCGACPPLCGDGTCGGTEDCAVCPKDCGACPGPCGDKTCDPAQGEDCHTCVEDCGICQAECGDGECASDAGEDCATCPADCGACQQCGDGECKAEETCSSCPDDCGPCPAFCGNDVCEWTEGCDNCLIDCGPCTAKCGDGFCTWPENCDLCAVDCPDYCTEPCGDRLCDPSEGEDCASCAADCGVCSAACGNGKCDDDEVCDNCPEDCGACPPTVLFARDWRLILSGPVIAGKPMRIVYDPQRNWACLNGYDGQPLYDIRIYYTWDMSVTAKSLPGVVFVNTSGGIKPAPAVNVVAVPANATDLWMWVQIASPIGNCVSWDSNGGDNHRVPVFAQSLATQDLAFAGDVRFFRDGVNGIEDMGDVDPAYYFASMKGNGISTWIQYAISLPGVTDRIYQNPAMAREIARLFFRNQVVTDAWGKGPPGQEPKPFPVFFRGQGGANDQAFVFRWFPGAPTWGAEPIADGAYRYRFETRTTGNATVHTIGAAGGGDRTVVLSQHPQCALFPKNPPKDYCP